MYQASLHFYFDKSPNDIFRIHITINSIFELCNLMFSALLSFILYLGRKDAFVTGYLQKIDYKAVYNSPSPHNVDYRNSYTVTQYPRRGMQRTPAFMYGINRPGSNCHIVVFLLEMMFIFQQPTSW